MIRTLIFMALLAMSLLTASCCLILPCCGYRGDLKPLDQTTRETLTLVKKEVTSSIMLTNEKVKCKEVEHYVGKEVIDSMKETIKQIDTLIAASLQLGKTATKEELMLFAERSNQVIMSTLINLKSLRDLYDISTCSQIETVPFFPADVSGITTGTIDVANKAIEPVAQRIVRFFADHPRQKFKAVILISCTYDGRERYGEGGCKGFANLGERRAKSVANVLADQLISKKEFIPNMELIHWDIHWIGKIVALPDAGKRRDTVSILWNLVPAAYANTKKMM